MIDTSEFVNVQINWQNGTDRGMLSDLSSGFWLHFLCILCVYIKVPSSRVQVYLHSVRPTVLSSRKALRSGE